MHIQFKKRVGKTISKGQMTFPKESEPFLDRNLKMPLGGSIPVKYKMANGTCFLGRLYQSENNGTTYYQSYISDESERKVFKQMIGLSIEIVCTFDMDNRLLNINPP